MLRRIVRMNKLKYGLLIVLIVVVLFWTSQIRMLNIIQGSTVASKQKQYYLDGQNVDGGYLSHVIETFEYAGIERTFDADKWDFMWSHYYPFGDTKRHGQMLKTLGSGRRLNKIPGTGWISSKQALSKIKNYKYMPTAFELPTEYDDFIKYRSTHNLPDQQWVIKSGKHRNIRILPDSELDSLMHIEEKFVQKMVSPPMLINGKKFDIGIYTVVTSAEPLRVYMLQSEWLIRFCKEDYYPFAAERTNGYVVGDDYTPIWDVEDLNKFYKNGYSMKESLVAYLKSVHIDIIKFEREFRYAVGEIWEIQQHKIRRSVNDYQVQPGQFFELFRMDFVLDEEANIFLLEVNMSPNLSSQTHPENAALYRSVLKNLFGLMQISSMYKSSDWEATLCNAGDPVDCNNVMNRYCRPCISSDNMSLLHQITSEHMNQNWFQLVSPLPKQLRRSYIEAETKLAHFQRGYFEMRCLNDHHWCQ